MRDLDIGHPKDNNERQYYESSRRRQFRKGDKVMVMARAESGESGWKNEWVEEMDTYIGSIGEVSRVDNYKGIVILMNDGTRNYAFPHFVLRKVE